MEHNAKCGAHSKIKHSNIGTVINGDVDIRCPAFNTGGGRDERGGGRVEDLDDLIEERQVRTELLSGARLWHSVAPLLAVLGTVFVWARVSQWGSLPAGELERMLYITCLTAMPAGIWLILPPVLRERHRAARAMIRTSVMRIAELDERIAYLRARDRRRQRGEGM